MKATIHYDTGDIYPIIAWLIGVTNYIKFYIKGEPYILGKEKLAETGIIRVTDADGKTLWSLNPEINSKETP